MGVHEFAAGFREVKRTLRNRCYRGVVASDSTHADYDAKALEWSRARDVLSGEDAVKAAGKKYLPRLDSQRVWITIGWMRITSMGCISRLGRRRG
jgi:hypothetical protein